MEPRPYQPLYPDKVRQRDLVTVCTGIALYVRKEGYWPKRKELHARLGCDLSALVYLVNHLIEYRYVERVPSKQAARYMLSSRGWDFIAVKPVLPWRRPPGPAIINRRINAIARRVALAEQTGVSA